MAPVYPILVPVPHTAEWELVRDFKYIWKDRVFQVPAGFRTDMASIPRFFHRVEYPSHPTVVRGAVAHDHAYRNHTLPRSDADDMLLAFWIEDGVSPTKAKIMYRAVRMFGSGSYNG